MAASYAQLREMADDEIVLLYDETAINTSPGLSFYLDELRRRAADREAEVTRCLARESQRLARRSFWLAFASFALGASNVLLAVLR